MYAWNTGVVTQQQRINLLTGNKTHPAIDMGLKC